MWQSVNRRVYQQISNKDVDIRGETLHFMQQQSELQRRNLSSFSFSSRHMKQNYSIFPALKIAL